MKILKNHYIDIKFIEEVEGEFILYICKWNTHVRPRRVVETEQEHKINIQLIKGGIARSSSFDENEDNWLNSFYFASFKEGKGSDYLILFFISFVFLYTHQKLNSFENFYKEKFSTFQQMDKNQAQRFFFFLKKYGSKRREK